MDFSKKARILEGMDGVVDNLRSARLRDKMGLGAPGEADVQIIKAKVPAEDITALEPGDDLQARTDIDMQKQGVYTSKRGMPAPAPAPQKPTAALGGGELVADASSKRAAQIEQLREILRNLQADDSGLDAIENKDDAEREAIRRALEKTEA